MKHLFSLLMSCVILTAPAVAGEDVPLLPREVRLLAQEAFHLTGSLGEMVWPGFTGRGAPALVVAGETEFLLGVERAPEGFEQAEDEPFMGRPVHVRGRVLPDTLLATFPAVGFNVVVVGTPEKTNRAPAHWVLTLAHELFHLLQGERGLDARVLDLKIGKPGDSDWHLNHPFPYEDEAVRDAMHILGFNLYRAARIDPESDEGGFAYEARTAGEALRNLLTLLRLQSGEERHGNYLRYQTTKEGVARYVEYRLARLAASGRYEPTPAFASAHGGTAYGKVWEEVYGDNMLNQVKHAGNVSRNRVEFYSLGLGIALLLDRLDHGEWKRHYFEEGGWTDGLLARALQGDRAASACRPADRS